MANLADPKAKRGRRILLVGDPGTGKSTAVGHLLEHGQKLFFMDFDDNLDPIREFVDPKYHENLHYETLVDRTRFHPDTGYPIVPGKPKAFKQFVKLTDRWVDSDTGQDFGPPEEWPDDHWLVIDSLSSLGNAAMYHTLSKNNRMGMGIRKKDWGDAIRIVAGVPLLLKSYPINTIMLAHLMRLTPDEDEDEDEIPSRPGQPKPAKTKKKLPESFLKRYPATLGQKLPPRIAGDFNIVLQTKIVGSGARAKRVILTVPESDVDVKLPGKAVETEVPIEGLFSIIKSLRGE